MPLDTAQLTNMLATITGRPEDPTVKGFAQLLVSALRDDDDDVEDHAARRARKRRAAMQRVARFQRMFQYMSDRNVFVAGALGACECWGADAACQRCGGRGVSGYHEPDPAAFDLLVLPLVRRRPHLFHALPTDSRVEAPTRDTEPGGGSHAGEPH
jgi:hypothetical protein